MNDFFSKFFSKFPTSLFFSKNRTDFTDPKKIEIWHQIFYLIKRVKRFRKNKK